jgi:hypothetical protein
MTNPLSSLGSALPITGTPQAASAAAAPRADVDVPAGGDFSALMNLQGRTRALVAKLTAQMTQLRDATGDPAKQAQAQQLQLEIKRLQELSSTAGVNPKSNSRHALAWAIQTVEGGGALTAAHGLRFKLAQRADQGDVKPADGAVLRRAIEAVTKAQDATAAASQDPTLVQDPSRLATFQQRMKAIQDAMDALGTRIGSGQLDGATIGRLDAAARQQNPGHVIRDVLATLQ